MRKTVLVLTAAAALAAPAAALADAAPTPADAANALCKAAQKQMTAADFAKAYKNFGQCVAKNAQQGTQAVSNAAKSCKTWQSDAAAFAAAMQGTPNAGKTFDQVYGANAQAHGKGAGANAYGKCVSEQAKQATDAGAKKLASAAKTCKAMLRSDAAAFAAKYGKTRNAFGKCVAAKGK